MVTSLLKLFICLVLFCSNSSLAAIYQCTDEQGHKSFQNRTCPSDTKTRIHSAPAHKSSENNHPTIPIDRAGNGNDTLSDRSENVAIAVSIYMLTEIANVAEQHCPPSSFKRMYQTFKKDFQKDIEQGEYYFKVQKDLESQQKHLSIAVNSAKYSYISKTPREEEIACIKAFNKAEGFKQKYLVR